ncbi:MAG: flavin reductase family protein [Coriobacteriales bacterium]|nr:flavin reductase family protein [Coriobacteriales bacterium]
MFYETDKNDHGLSRAPFKSCVVPRPIGWLSTVNADGVPNLAPYSQFTNLTFDPPYVLVSINRKLDGERKDTALNIEATGEFVYNIVPYALRDAMDITAAPFPSDVDEFEKAGLTKAPCEMVDVPRVAESPINLECKYVQTIILPGTSRVGTADVIIGKVVGVHIDDDYIMEDDKIDMEKIRPLARMGYSDYTSAESVFELSSSKDFAIDSKERHGMEGATGKLD